VGDVLKPTQEVNVLIIRAKVKRKESILLKSRQTTMKRSNLIL
jgi:hypothetical protein